MSAAISGAWGGLFTAPFTALLLNLELTLERSVLRWARITADATAAIVGFAIFFAVDAGWSDVLRLLKLPSFDFGILELGLAAGFGVLGAIVGTAFKLSMVATGKLAAPHRESTCAAVHGPRPRARPRRDGAPTHAVPRHRRARRCHQ